MRDNLIDEEKLSAVDFARSSFTWLLAESPSYGRFGIDAALTVVDLEGITETFYLGSQVFGGNVYGEGELFKLPAYEFAAAISAIHYRIFRASHGPNRQNDNHGAIEDRFARARLDVTNVQCRRIRSIATEMLPNQQLVGRVRVPGASRGCALELQFPIRHINVDARRNAFQVETGPVLALSMDGGSPAERLRRAYLIFNRLDCIAVLLDDPRPEAFSRWSARLDLPCEIELLRTAA